MGLDALERDLPMFHLRHFAYLAVAWTLLSAHSAAAQSPSKTQLASRRILSGATDENPGESIASLIQNLRSKDIGIRGEALDGLSKLGKKATDAIPGLIEALKDEDERVRAAVLLALANIGEASAPRLSALAGDKKPSLRLRLDALYGLRLLGPKAQSSIPTLVRLLKADEPDIRDAAILALGPTRTDLAATELIKLLSDQNASIRASAAFSLGCTQKKDATAHLVKMIRKDKDEDVRFSAIQGLSQFRDSPELVIPALTRILSEDADTGLIDSGGAGQAVRALVYFGRPSLQSLLQIVENPKVPHGIRADAIQGIGTIAQWDRFGTVGPEGEWRLREDEVKSMVSSLAKALLDKDAEVRTRACDALGRFSSKAVLAVPVLKQVIKKAKGYDLVFAARALLEIDPAETLSIDALTGAISDKDKAVRALALVALRDHGWRNKSGAARISLEKALEHKEADVRVIAAKSLALIGSKKSVPSLTKASKDENDEVRFAAARAIEEIQSGMDE
jgi:HEAT repeat protein